MAGEYGKKEIFDFLDDRKTEYKKLEHEAVYTMEDMDSAGITKMGKVCKNLFLRDAKGKNHYLVMAPEEKRTDLKSLSEKIGSTKLSFASPERLKKYLGVEQGSVSPLGVLNDENAAVTVVLDREILSWDEVGIHPNDNTATLWLKPGTLLDIIKEHGNPVITAEI